MIIALSRIEMGNSGKMAAVNGTPDRTGVMEVRYYD